MPLTGADDDLASIFDADAGEGAETATYTPAAGGAATTVTVLLDQPVTTEQLGRHDLSAETTVVLVRASAVADPRGGSTWTIDGTAYACNHAELSADRKVWTAYLEEVS